MAELKTKKNSASVEEFLNSITDDKKRQDSVAICKMIEAVSGQKPKMWGTSIIGFGTYTYTYKTGTTGEWMRVGFSPRKQNLTLYIMPGFDVYAEMANYNPKPLLDKLGKYSTGKSCLYIKQLEDVDIKVLRQLVAASLDALNQLYPG